MLAAVASSLQEISAPGMLGLAVGLALANLLIVLRLRRTVQRLEGKLDSLAAAPPAVPAPPPAPAPEPEPKAAAAKTATVPESDSDTAPAAGAAQPATPAAVAAMPPRRRRGEAEGGPPAKPDAIPAVRDQAADPPWRQVAELLEVLYREAPRLADQFLDRELREGFRGEFGAPLKAKIERLAIAAGQGEDELRRHWLNQDLVTALDALSRFYSEAASEGQRGSAAGRALAARLRALLYESLSGACQRTGWFVIDPVEPYQTPFDPRVHQAVAGADVAGASGLVVGIKSAGLRDVRGGAIQHRAEVIVGR